MKKIKILMVGQLPLDLSSVKGGVVAVIVNLFSGFRKLNNIEIVHVSFNKEIDAPATLQYATNIKIHYLPYKVKVELVDYFINRRLFNDILIAEKPDLIHIQEITPHLLRFIFLAKEKIVVTQHGIMSEELKTAVGIGNKIKYLFKAYVEKYLFPLFINIIFISNYNRELFPHKEIFSSLIANPVNPIFFNSAKSVSVLNSLIYVGVINERKNLKLILEALAILKKENVIFNLNVVGGYKEAFYENEIQAIVNKYNLTEQVVFHGWQTQEQILKLYEHCSIMILPSQQETMPISIAEAMAQGKVVLASNVGAISEMIDDKTSGFLFEKNNVEQLSDLLRQLFNNQGIMEIVSLQARKEANEKFHPDFIAIKTLEFYNQVIEKSSSLLS